MDCNWLLVLRRKVWLICLVSMRLNQFLAHHLGWSRRQVDQLIAAGQVKVNQKLAKLGTRVNLTDQVEIYRQGCWLDIKQVTIEKLLFYKPIFCFSNPEARVFNKKTIKNFLPRNFQDFHPVYKLAYMTEGLLLLGRNRLICKSLKNELAASLRRFLLATKNRFPEVVDFSWMQNLEQPNELGQVELTAFTDWIEFSYLKLNPQHYWYWVTGRGLTDRMIINFSLDFGLQRLICVEVGPYRLTIDLYQQKWLSVR